MPLILLLLFRFSLADTLPRYFITPPVYGAIIRFMPHTLLLPLRY